MSGSSGKVAAELHPQERRKTGTGRTPEQYRWSSFNHFATGIRGAVEIESEWTAGIRGPLIAIKPR
jgi:hypothetical protein